MALDANVLISRRVASRRRLSGLRSRQYDCHVSRTLADLATEAAQTAGGTAYTKLVIDENVVMDALKSPIATLI